MTDLINVFLFLKLKKIKLYMICGICPSYPSNRSNNNESGLIFLC